MGSESFAMDSPPLVFSIINKKPQLCNVILSIPLVAAGDFDSGETNRAADVLCVPQDPVCARLGQKIHCRIK
jgi:hypothetical protein